MRVEGEKTVFDHVGEYCYGQELHPRILIIVNFDGEPDLWAVKDGSDASSALEELREYYLRDWYDTGRELPVTVYYLSSQDVISC